MEDKKEQLAETAPKAAKVQKIDFKLPEISEFLKAGVQFGHQARRWNPKMKKYIFAQRGDIHIIDIVQTYDNLEKALNFLVDAASKGDVLFVGTKRQARDIVKEAAMDAGTHFVIHRWVGGLLTNYEFIRKSLKRLAKLESDFETGIQGRTKFEISRMKKEWERLNRLYSGIKTMQTKPTAVVVLDTKYEKNAIKEAKRMGVPVVSVVDTNADPDVVNYPIPGNDDAVAAIKLYFDLFSKAVKQGNKAGSRGVKHVFKDYMKTEVEIVKAQEDESEAIEVAVVESEVAKPKPIEVEKPKKVTRAGEGILESVQKAREAARVEVKAPAKKVVEKPGKEKETKKEVKKEVKKTVKAKKNVKAKKVAAKRKSKKAVK